jgi:hypothetical protein
MSKSNFNVLKALKKIYLSYADFPSSFSTDKGKEFTGALIQNWFKENDVKYFNSHGNTKAQFAERFVKILKSHIFRYMEAKKSFDYVNNLKNIVSDINNTESRSTKMIPSKVNYKNAHKVFLEMYGSIPNLISNLMPSEKQKLDQKFKINDLVRIQVQKGKFDKKYENNFSKEIFKISEILFTNPIQYKVEDLKNESIIGKFVKEELQKIEN